MFHAHVNASNADLALTGATIYTSPTEDAIRDSVVLIHDRKIAAVGTRSAVQIPQGVETIDLAGRTITAGFWNSHVHFFERKWANAASMTTTDLRRQLQQTIARYGFTNVFDTGSEWENTRQIRDRVESGEVPGPKIRSTGEALIARGVMTPELETVIRMMGAMKFPGPEVSNADEAAASAERLLANGVDAIKVHLQPPTAPSTSISESAIQAAVRVAHRAGKLVFVHPHTGVDVLKAIRAGVDVIAHTTPHSGPWDETIFSEVKDRDVALTPTLTLWKYFARHDRISTQDQIVHTELSQLRGWIKAGGEVLFGTDLGAVDPDPTDEYALMAQAGMSFREILASLSTLPAARFGESRQLGGVGVGLQADLVVLKDDPSNDIRALASVQYTLRDGKIIYRASD